MKAPFSSVTRVTTGWVASSQYRVRFSFFRKNWPVTVMLVVSPPAVGCRPIVAPLGRGAYTIAAFPVAPLVLVALTVNAYVMLSERFEAT